MIRRGRWHAVFIHGSRRPIGEVMPNQLTASQVAKAEMLIRRPVEEVFEAFVDPSITSKFWFTRGSGRLEPHKTVTWEWAMYDLSIQVAVKAVEPNRRILIEWPGYDGLTTVEWRFTSRPDGTFVSITNAGFTETSGRSPHRQRVRPRVSRWSLRG